MNKCKELYYHRNGYHQDGITMEAWLSYSKSCSFGGPFKKVKKPNKRSFPLRNKCKVYGHKNILALACNKQPRVKKNGRKTYLRSGKRSFLIRNLSIFKNKGE